MIETMKRIHYKEKKLSQITVLEVGWSRLKYTILYDFSLILLFVYTQNQGEWRYTFSFRDYYMDERASIKSQEIQCLLPFFVEPPPSVNFLCRLAGE